MDLELMQEKLEKMLRPKRFRHSVNTMQTAAALAKFYKVDIEKATIAGLLHDCAKNLSDEDLLDNCIKYGIAVSELEHRQPFLLHGAVGAVIAKNEFGIEDTEILRAISCHTTGCVNMSKLDKIIFLSDYIEPAREHKQAETVRRLVYEDIDKAMLYTYDSVIKYVISKNGLIHPNTIEARNELLM